MGRHSHIICFMQAIVLNIIIQSSWRRFFHHHKMEQRVNWFTDLASVTIFLCDDIWFEQCALSLSSQLSYFVYFWENWKCVDSWVLGFAGKANGRRCRRRLHGIIYKCKFLFKIRSIVITVAESIRILTTNFKDCSFAQLPKRNPDCYIECNGHFCVLHNFSNVCFWNFVCFVYH